MSVVYRQAQPSDINFVTNSWMRSFRDSDTAGFIGIHSWSEVAEREIRRILRRDGVELYVAGNPDANPELKIDAHGWVAVERGFFVPAKVLVGRRRKRVMRKSQIPLVHYCFVKPQYRGFGLARGLFEKAGVDPEKPFLYSCSTAVVASLRAVRKIPGGKWDPKICRFPRDHRKERRHVEGNSNSTHPIREELSGGAGR